MTYNIIFGNIGIDYWTENKTENKVSQEGEIYNEYERSYQRENFIPFSKLFSDRVKGYTCYFDNKPYSNYLTSAYNNIKGFDIYVLIEFCPRLLTVFNDKYRSYYILNYEFFKPYETPFPEELKKNPTLIDSSKKSFIMYTNNPDVKIKSFFDEDFDSTIITKDIEKVSYGKDVKFNAEGIQVGYIVIKNIKILTLNIHIRKLDRFFVNEKLDNIIKIIDDSNDENIIVFGDFNSVVVKNFCKDDLIKRGFVDCIQKVCSDKDTDCPSSRKKCSDEIINSVYNQLGKKCNKRIKNKLLGLFYKLKNFNLEINEAKLNCNLNLNTSSHMFVPVKLTYIDENNVPIIEPIEKKELIPQKSEPSKSYIIPQHREKKEPIPLKTEFPKSAYIIPQHREKKEPLPQKTYKLTKW